MNKVLLNQYDFKDIDDFTDEMYACVQDKSDEFILTCALALAASSNLGLGLSAKKISELFKEAETAQNEYALQQFRNKNGTGNK